MKFFISDTSSRSLTQTILKISFSWDDRSFDEFSEAFRSFLFKQNELLLSLKLVLIPQDLT